MKKEEKQLLQVCKDFEIKGKYLSYRLIESGHINSTYQVCFERETGLKEYIVQRVNTYVFQNPAAVMENISLVTEFIREKIKAMGRTAKRNVLHYAQTAEGNYYTVLPDGSFWRCCRFIEDSASFTMTNDLKIIEESGKAFGEFQTYLSDFPVKKLHIVIPHFHNTVMRFETLERAAKEDEMGRLEEVQEVLAGYREIREIATKPYRLQRKGVLKLRVTHNDTKTSNVLFDKDTGEHLSVIDLDTVMPGLIAFDFGDAIRAAGSTADEDEKDLDKVALDIEKYEAFTRGFVSNVKDMLTEAERDTLALGAVAMTAECGARFLTDYLQGDKYFRIHYDDQNLVRAKCQLKLAQDMSKQLDVMQGIVEKYCK